MKKIILGTVLMVFLAYGANAQDGRHHKRTKQDYSLYKNELNLTDAQKDQVKKIREEYRGKMLELKKNENITVKDWKQKKQTIATEQRTALMNVLTSEQKDKLKQLRQRSSEERKTASAAKRKDFENKLGLTTEQREKMQAANKEFHTKVKGLKDNEALAADAKKEQITALKKEHREEIRSLLTKEQVEKLKEIRSERTNKSRTR